MQITDLYQTKITCSTYNADIDSTNTVITVKLVDFNGEAVKNKSVTLTCDKGYFNKNGSNTISGTTTKSITATTNDSGEITATWTASEWGLCTFSTNTISTQVNVTGWKNLHTNTGLTMDYNGEFIKFNFNDNISIAKGGWSNIRSFNKNYAPQGMLWFPTNDGNVEIRINPSDGFVQAYNKSTTSVTTSLGFCLVYPKTI